ncbi:MAG TPA: DUF1549 domain-containing protein [Planctomycetota bacterium]|nr:DUF1549 domain-containing protein [Planctomycetota bacterium]
MGLPRHRRARCYHSSAAALTLLLSFVGVPCSFAADFSPPDKAAALDAVKAMVGEAAKSGKKIDVWLNMFGSLQKAELSKVDAKNVTVKVQNNPFDQPWDKISQDQIAAMAKACVLGDAKRALTLADYCLATEQKQKAEEALEMVSQLDPKMTAELGPRFKYVGSVKQAEEPVIARVSAAVLTGTGAGASSSGSAPVEAKPYAPPPKIAFKPSEPGLLVPVKEVAAAIDNAIEIDLAEMGIRPEPLCDDTAFLRRATLDLTGQIPSPEEVIEFFKSPDSNKRAKKVGELLQRAEYADHWATFWNVLLVGRRTRSDADINTPVLRGWLREQFSKNVAYDKMVTELLTATGSNDKSGPANYLTYHLNDTLPNTMAHLSQTFLGARIGCAQCHDHPFDKWTQQDFWGFAAFLANTRSDRREEKNDPKDKNRVTRAWHVLVDQDNKNGGGRYDPPSGDLKLPPKALDGPVLNIAPLAKNDSGGGEKKKRRRDNKPEEKPAMQKPEEKKDGMMAGGMMGMDGDMAMGMAGSAAEDAGSRGLAYRRALANWITSPKNEKFSQSVVNRVWRSMFGYGLVEPIDDIRPKNPPSHPAAMDILVQDFNASGRDLKRLMSVIAATKAYQRASVGNSINAERHKAVRYAARAEVRPMTPEMLLTAIVKATGGDEKADALMAGLRARDTAMMEGKMDNVSDDVRQFGDLMQRFINTSTAEDRAGKLQFEGTVAQALMMMHSNYMTNAVKSGVERFKKKGMGDMVYIFAATLGRPPSNIEAAAFSNQTLEDIMWVLLNSAEFVTIH